MQPTSVPRVSAISFANSGVAPHRVARILWSSEACGSEAPTDPTAEAVALADILSSLIVATNLKELDKHVRNKINAGVHVWRV